MHAVNDIINRYLSMEGRAIWTATWKWEYIEFQLKLSYRIGNIRFPWPLKIITKVFSLSFSLLYYKGHRRLDLSLSPFLCTGGNKKKFKIRSLSLFFSALKVIKKRSKTVFNAKSLPALNNKQGTTNMK